MEPWSSKQLQVPNSSNNSPKYKTQMIKGKNTSYHLLVTEYLSGFNQNVSNESEDIGFQESVCVLFHHHLKLKMKFTADHMDKQINFQGKVLWSDEPKTSCQ